MVKQCIKDAILWGGALWLIGYVLGILLFFIIPLTLIGWVILPVGVLITVWVLLRKVKQDSFKYYLLLSVAWTLIAIVCDYFFLVKVFKPTDNYYKLDVYVYYTLTFLLPLVVGWKKSSSDII